MQSPSVEMSPASQSARLGAYLLAAAAAAWIIALLHKGHSLTWDEIEFFRATKWVALGKLPYRDFWEHHTPLQWFVFAPVAWLVRDVPGTAAIVAMRWAQVPLWIGTFVLVLRVTARVGAGRAMALAAVALICTSRTFIGISLQYRIDTLALFAFVVAVVFLLKQRFVLFGLAASVAVLTNMRLVPLVVIAAIVAFWWRDSSWGWNPKAFRMFAGVAFVAALFCSGLLLTGTWSAFVTDVVDLNLRFDRVVRAGGSMLLATLLTPLRVADLSGIALWVASIAGMVFAVREWRRASALQVVTILFVVAVAMVVFTGVQYDYHLQTAYLLMVPLAASAFQRLMKSSQAPLVPPVLFIFAAVSLAVNAGRTITSDFGVAMSYQNAVMEAVDLRTLPGEKVWDGTGYALNREPASEYWFLPALVRKFAADGFIPAYDVRRDPPAAIIFNYRLQLWFAQFPDGARYSVHHYVPLYRNLWIPGMSGLLPGAPVQFTWRVPKTDEYEIVASEPLGSHPWLRRPLEYARAEGADAAGLEIVASALPRIPAESMQWAVDGRPVPPGVTILRLRKGSKLQLFADHPTRAGVLVIPRGVDVLCRGTEARFVF